MMRAPLLLTAMSTAALTMPTHAMQVVLAPSHTACAYAFGSIEVTVTGGTPPYTYLWNDASTESYRTGLSAGIYSVTVTDALAEQVTEEVEILSLPYAFYSNLVLPYCNMGAQLFPTGEPLPPGWPSLDALAPWFVNGEQLQPPPGYGGTDPLWVFYPTEQFYNYTIMDANGCTGTIIGELGEHITSWPTLTVTDVEPSCTNYGIGAIHLLSSDEAPGGNWPVWINVVHENGDFTTVGVDDFTHEAHITGIGPGTYKIHWWLGATAEILDPGECGHDTLWVTVPSLGNACGALGGISWYDVNGDCVRDVNEVGIPYSPMELQPGGEIILTGSDGGFDVPLLNGSYTLEQLDPALVHICPATQPIPFTVNTNETVLALANSSTEPLDLRASIATGTARPGFAMGIGASARNLSPQVSGPVTFIIELDPTVIYDTATPTPTLVAGNTLTWDLPAFNSFQMSSFNVSCTVPASTLLGTVLQNTATVSNTLPDNDPSNDIDVANTTVTGSVDPNDKTVRTSSGYSETAYFIGTDTWLDYTIRFQNTGTDTAFTVVVTDTLPAELDMMRFQQGAMSHNGLVSFKPGRVVEWRFNSIMLPDSNVNEAASHGLTSFRILPHAPVLPGTVISNNADIFFDFNAPVRTNDAVLTAQINTGMGEEHNAPCRAITDGEDLIVFAHSNAFSAKSMRILTTDGRAVRSQGALRIDPGGTAVSIAGLARGSYVLALIGADGSAWSHRFVVL